MTRIKLLLPQNQTKLLYIKTFDEVLHPQKRAKGVSQSAIYHASSMLQYGIHSTTVKM